MNCAPPPKRYCIHNVSFDKHCPYCCYEHSAEYVAKTSNVPALEHTNEKSIECKDPADSDGDGDTLPDN